MASASSNSRISRRPPARKYSRTSQPYRPRRPSAIAALYQLSVLFAYSLPGPGGPQSVVGRHGVSGPGPEPAGRLPARRWKSSPSPATATLEADVVVVGSGSGGGVAAAVLAEAGKRVIILEAGGYYNESDFVQSELAAYQKPVPARRLLPFRRRHGQHRGGQHGGRREHRQLVELTTHPEHCARLLGRGRPDGCRNPGIRRTPAGGVRTHPVQRQGRHPERPPCAVADRSVQARLLVPGRHTQHRPE